MPDEEIKIVAPVEGETESIELDEVETEARTMGWVPEDIFEGDKERWVDAETYMKIAPYIKQTNSQKRKIKNLQDANAKMLEHHNKHAEGMKANYDSQIAQLRQALELAAQEGDTDRVTLVTDAILETERNREGYEQAPVGDITQEVKEFHEEWVATNTWYDTDPQMKENADDLARGILAKYATPQGALSVSVEDIYDELDKKIAMMYPAKLGRAQSIHQTTSVADGTPPAKVGASLASVKRNMSPEEKKVMKSLVQQKVMTEEQYLKELKESGPGA